MNPLQPNLIVAEHLGVADLVVFFGILALTALVVVWGNSLKKRGGDSFIEYLLMGRRLTLPLFTATLVASWYGGIFGVTEIAFQHGVYNFITQGVFWYAAYLVFAFFLVDRVRGSSAVTLPELVGKMFGPRAGCVAAVFNFFNVLPVAYVISIGLFAQTLFGGGLFWCTALGTIAITLYSMWGGFRAVVFSDIIQFGVMCASVALVVFFSWADFGGRAFLEKNLPVTHFDPLGGHSLAQTLVWGFIAFGTLVDPNFYQRCFAAESARTAKRGILIATMIWCVFDLCTTLGGMYARALIPDAQPGKAYLYYAMQILPPGLRGFFLAGVLAIILSTLDSFMFVASNTLSYDLGPKRFRNNVWFGHAGTLAASILAILISFSFDGSVKTAWKTLGSYSAGCLIVPMMIGFWRPGRISDKGFVLATLMGAVGVTYWRLMPHAGFWAEVDDLYAGIACTLTGLVIGGVVFPPVKR